MEQEISDDCNKRRATSESSLASRLSGPLGRVVGGGAQCAIVS